MSDSLPEALLFLGPTGSGKTPLGDFLARRGLGGRACRHFDFGARLRSAAMGETAGFSGGEVRFFKDVLETGALLENETFHLAGRILTAFIQEQCRDPGDLMVMNGLPRHAGQAQDVDRLVDVRRIVQLDCPAATVRERILRDSGGDRAGRADDGLDLVQRKLEIFAERTLPLLEHYRGRGCEILRIEAMVEDTAESLASKMGSRIS